AFYALKKDVNYFYHGTSYKDLYNIGEMALLAGDNQEALFLFRLALQKVPSQDILWGSKIRENLSSFENNPAK
ncbi:MAG: hypothetical protein HQK89_13360, partial [Nitrospirae bacterium]|nr:hypothetical protein [Nitrospirota bacterium]